VLEDDFTVDMQCDAEKTKYHLRSSTKNMHRNGWPLKYHIFCRVLREFWCQRFKWEVNS